MAMIMAIVALALGSLLIIPTLNYSATAVQATEIKERRTGELYAADAGIENAIWELASNNLTLAEGTQVTLPQIQLNRSMVETTVFHIPGGRLPTYQIVSTANSTGSSETTIEAQMYIGNLLFTHGLASGGNITLGNNCTINGDIYYEDQLAHGWGYSHNGTITTPGSLDLPSDEQNTEFARKFKDEAMAGGNHTGSLVINADTNLGPLYIPGNLTVRKNRTVTLTGTIYVEGWIDCKKDSTFTGDGSIVAVGRITMDKVGNYGTNGASVIMSLTSDIIIKNQSTINALIYVPNGLAHFQFTTTVVGSIVAAEIHVQQGATITFDEDIKDLDLPGDGPHVQGWRIH